MGTHTRRAAVVLAALLAIAPGTGCKSSRPSPAPVTLNQATQRRSEAMQLADQAYQAEQSGNPHEAEELYRESIIRDPAIFASWNNLGELLLLQGDTYHAVEAFSEASFLSPNDPRPEYNIAVAYQKAGFSEDAIKHFDNALSRNEFYKPALRGAIKAAAQLGMADRDVQRWIRQALLSETHPEWLEFFNEQRFRVDAALEEQRYAD